VRFDRTLACWGNNFAGQLVGIPAGTFLHVSVGGVHSCAVRTDRTVACWGANPDGQAAAPAGTFAEVSAGDRHSCGLRTDGTLACWGFNTDGRATPPAGTFTQVAAGGSHSCGVRSNGAVICWGSNSGGQLGSVPQTPGPAPVQTVGAGAYSHSFTSSSGTPAGGFAVGAGSLPTGLILSPGGQLSGTPAAEGLFSFTVTASNPMGSATQAFTIFVDRTPPTVTCGAAPSFTVGGSDAQNVTASVADSGSGPVSVSVVVDVTPADIASAGSKTKVVTGVDKAGNQSTASCPFTVVAPAPASASGGGDSPTPAPQPTPGVPAPFLPPSGKKSPVCKTLQLLQQPLSGKNGAQVVKVRVTKAGIPVRYRILVRGAGINGTVLTGKDGLATIALRPSRAGTVKLGINVRPSCSTPKTAKVTVKAPTA
jgi:hypothetical protein